MTDSLIVEDGTGVSNADSYVTLQDARDIALSRGWTLSADDDKACVTLRNGFDWIEGQSGQLNGVKVATNAFPRTDLYVENVLIGADVIPVNVKRAQVLVATLVESGIELFAATSTPELKRKKTGPLEREWFEGFNSDIANMPQVNYLMAPYYCNASGTLYLERG